MQVAQTILQQLGGKKFIAMTGASSFSGSPDTLSFRIPKTKGIAGVRITLDQSDTYTMTFVRLKKVNGFTDYDNIVVAGVYADQLRSIFTKETGLYTSLGTMGGNP